MDLKQEVSLERAGSAARRSAYPVKTSINLVDTQQQRGNLLAQLGLFTIALVLIGVFAKFAVVDPFGGERGKQQRGWCSAGAPGCAGGRERRTTVS